MANLIVCDKRCRCKSVSWLLVVYRDRHLLDVVLDSPVAMEANEFLSLTFNISMLKIEQNSLSQILVWLDDVCKLVKKHLLFPWGISKTIPSFKWEMLLPLLVGRRPL